MLFQCYCQTHQNDDTFADNLKKGTSDVSSNLVNRIFAYKRRKDLPTFSEDIISSKSPLFRDRRIENNFEKKSNNIDVIYSIKVDGIKRSTKKNNFLMRKKIRLYPFDFDTLGGLGLGKRTVY
uniref:Uncharacterized protein n=1 Tax=Strongyloides venezuelensis TaxID=75913 RepID=A0A0K0G509_STRVS